MGSGVGLWLVRLGQLGGTAKWHVPEDLILKAGVFLFDPLSQLLEHIWLTGLAKGTISACNRCGLPNMMHLP